MECPPSARPHYPSIQSELNHSFDLYCKFKALDKVPAMHSGQEYWGFDPTRLHDIEVVVYSGGKTATTTLERSFRRFTTSIRLHNWKDFYEKYPFAKEYQIRAIDLIKYVHYTTGKRLLVVSAYREPVSRAVSSFFSNLAVHVRKPLDEIVRMTWQDLEPYFFRVALLETYHPHVNPQRFCGVDIFCKPFDHTAGFNRYETEYADILILRFDQLNRWAEIIQRQTRFTHFQLLSANRSLQRADGELYCSFKRKFRPPLSILQKLFLIEDKNLEYFHTIDQLMSLRRAWFERSVDRGYPSPTIPLNFSWRRYLAENSLLGRVHADTEYYARRHYIAHHSTRVRP